MVDKNKVTYIGTTDFRNQQVKFGIKAEDRSRHMYIIGKTGMGKSTVLENLAAQDIATGDGMVFIDPHGSAIEKLLDYIPQHRINDVIYFAPFDTDFPISFNVMENIDHDRRHLVVSGLMASFKKIWQDAWSERMAYILTNTILALLETPNTTLLGVNRMYADKSYRDMIIGNITDNSVKSFWLEEYNKWDVKYAREATAAIQNKIGQFTGNPLIRNIIGQPQSSFDFRRAMDERKIILINLSKGLIGEENMRLLGGMIITKLYLAAMSRADVGTYALDTLPPCYFFVDEFQNFANESFADILAEARKYKLNLTVANQYIAQMEDAVRDAVFGNVGSMISFRVGPFDAEVLERAFMPVFTKEDLVNIAQFQMYLTLSIDAVGSKPFSAGSLPPIPKPDISFKDQVISASRAQYAQPRASVEQDILKWFEPLAGSPAAEKQGASAPFNPNFDAQKASEEIRKKEALLDPADFPPVSSDGAKPVVVAQQSVSPQPVQRPPQSLPKKQFVPKKEPAISSTLQSLIDKIDAPVQETQKSMQRDTPNTQQAVHQSSITQEELTHQDTVPTPGTQSRVAVESAPKRNDFSRAAGSDSKQALRDLLKKIQPAAPASPSVSNTPQKAAVQPTVTSTAAPVTEPTASSTPASVFKEAPSQDSSASSIFVQPNTMHDVASPPKKEELSSQGAYSPGQPKEVPEDVLRKILE